MVNAPTVEAKSLNASMPTTRKECAPSFASTRLGLEMFRRLAARQGATFPGCADGLSVRVLEDAVTALTDRRSHPYRAKFLESGATGPSGPAGQRCPAERPKPRSGSPLLTYCKERFSLASTD